MPLLARLLALRPGVAPRPAAEPESAFELSSAVRLTFALALLGLLVRLVRYLIHPPIWGDEVFVCQNFIGRGYAGMLTQLENGQIVPPLFLWGQLAVFRQLGGGGLAMRLLPLLAAVGGLGLVWAMARKMCRPAEGLVAVGLLAVATWPVSMAHFAKPYSFDLLFAAALQLAAVWYLAAPDRLVRLLLLAVLTPLALLGSYPAAFVAGGVCLAVLPAVWKQSHAAKAVYGLMAVGMFAAFLFAARVGDEQLNGTVTPTIKAFLDDYWKDGFPPKNPLRWPGWFLTANTGRLFAYPVGDKNGGSAITFLLFLVGVREWARAGRWSWLTLFLAPFALNLVAAALHKYPYGGCCRLAQHLAPAIVLLAGTGAAVVGRAVFRTASSRTRAGFVSAGLFVAIGWANTMELALKPYHDPEALWSQKLVGEMKRNMGPHDRIHVLNPADAMPPVIRYHLRLLGDRVSWLEAPDLRAAVAGRVWVLDVWPSEAATADHEPAAGLTWVTDRWPLQRHYPFAVLPVPGDRVSYHADVYLCGRGPLPRLSAGP